MRERNFDDFVVFYYYLYGMVILSWKKFGPWFVFEWIVNYNLYITGANYESQTFNKDPQLLLFRVLFSLQKKQNELVCEISVQKWTVGLSIKLEVTYF